MRLFGFKQILTIPNKGKNVEQLDLSYIAGWNGKWHSHLRKQDNSFLQSYTYIEYIIHLFIPSYLSKRNTNVYSYKNEMQMLLAALFIIATNWKPLK